MFVMLSLQFTISTILGISTSKLTFPSNFINVMFIEEAKSLKKIVFAI